MIHLKLQVRQGGKRITSIDHLAMQYLILDETALSLMSRSEYLSPGAQTDDLHRTFYLV